MIGEQNPSLALRHAQSVTVLRNGEVATSGPASDFESHEALMEAYAGTEAVLLDP